MTLEQTIEYHRETAREMLAYTPGWYFHEAKAAKAVREWRKSNTLRGINGQK